MSRRFMRYTSPRALLLGLFVSAFGLANIAIPLSAQPCGGTTPPCVLTSQYGNLRQSWNGNETTLTTSNVTQLTTYATLAVDNSSSGLGTYNPIYGQPLYVAGITVASAYQTNCSPTCNMLVAVTAYGSIWAWNADTGNTIFSRTALWNSDCLTGSSVARETDGGTGTAPFGGVLSTPVIDPNIAIPNTSHPTLYGVMFLTNVCKTSGGTVEWFLHQIDLTDNLQDINAGPNSPLLIQGSAAASGGADDQSGTTVTFTAFEESQRSALLEVKNTFATPNPVIYVPFGSAVPEAYNSSGYPTHYHGWVFAYTVTGSNSQMSLVSGFPLLTTSEGYNTTGSPPCCQDCNVSQGQSGATNCVPSGYQNSPNWCGHGGGIWMSMKGAASNTLGSGSSQIAYSYFGTGNGGFQTNGNNLGQSLFDLRLSQLNGADSAPYQSFTSHGGPQGCSPTGTQCQPALQPPLGSACPNEGGNCQYTVEVTNENDWDVATGGILLFDDASGGQWLVTVDKDGYGHLLKQGQVCSTGYPAVACTGQEFVQGDTGDWVFGALAANFCHTLGTSQASNCHRITSLAFYNYTLYFWPYQEQLTSLQFADISTQTSGPGGVSTSSPGDGYVHANGTACDTGYTCPCNAHHGTCFTSKVAPGDFLIIGGCTASLNPSTNTCPVITSVQSDTLLYLSFDPGVTTPASWQYSGYFVKPDYKTTPTSVTWNTRGAV